MFQIVSIFCYMFCIIHFLINTGCHRLRVPATPDTALQLFCIYYWKILICSNSLKTEETNRDLNR